MRAAKEGRNSAWSAVFQRYELMLRGHIRVLAARHRTGIDPEEVVQATFARAWSQIQSFDFQGEGSLRRWLYRMAKNLYLSELRSHAQRPEQSAESGVFVRTEDERGSARDAAHLERLSVDEALAELDEEDREILLMHSDEDLNLNQIAAVLECSHETARRRLGLAMTRLHQRLGGGRR